MKVVVKVFAGLRERAGWRERELELPDGARARDVFAAAGLEAEPGVMLAVNEEYVEGSHPLADGDEVALIPPVSGGAFRLAAGPLDVGAVTAEVADEEAGAVATFVGRVRRRSRGRTVRYLEYEAYGGMAEKVMAALADDLKGKYELREVAIAHRVGRVDVGEASVVVAVSAAHRHAALSACQEAIDTLKETVPLWKKEVYEGGEEWIGRGS